MKKKPVLDSQNHIFHEASREYIRCEKLSAPASPNLSPHSLALRLLSCPIHIHIAPCCSLGDSFMVGTQSLCLSCSAASTSTAKFHLAPGLFHGHWGQPVPDLLLLSLPSDLCSSSLIPISIKSSDNFPGQIWAKLLFWEPHSAPCWRRRLPAERLQLLGSICI